MAQRRFLGLVLCLYIPQSETWRIYWASSKDGSIDPPLTAEFKNGRGEFYSRDWFGGKAIVVRAV